MSFAISAARPSNQENGLLISCKKTALYMIAIPIQTGTTTIGCSLVNILIWMQMTTGGFVSFVSTKGGFICRTCFNGIRSTSDLFFPFE